MLLVSELSVRGGCNGRCLFALAGLEQGTTTHPMAALGHGPATIIAHHDAHMARRARITHHMSANQLRGYMYYCH